MRLFFLSVYLLLDHFCNACNVGLTRFMKFTTIRNCMSWTRMEHNFLILIFRDFDNLLHSNNDACRARVQGLKHSNSKRDLCLDGYTILYRIKLTIWIICAFWLLNPRQ